MRKYIIGGLIVAMIVIAAVCTHVASESADAHQCDHFKLHNTGSQVANHTHWDATHAKEAPGYPNWAWEKYFTGVGWWNVWHYHCSNHIE